MAQPKQKYWGSLNLDQLKAALAAVETSDYKGEKQVRIGAAQWEDNNISIDIYDKESKTSFKVANLRVSQFDDEPAKSDLPF